MSKVLLVEDNQEKIKAIAAIVEGKGESWDLSIVGDVANAKRAMQRQRFDLLLLDIHLPTRANKEPEAGGGLNILRWLTNHTDVLVVAALADPELQAVLRLPACFEHIEVSHDASAYY